MTDWAKYFLTEKERPMRAAYAVERKYPEGDDAVDEVWMCEPPGEGVEYQVIRQVWNEEMTVRTIYEIKVAE